MYNLITIFIYNIDIDLKRQDRVNALTMLAPVETRNAECHAALASVSPLFTLCLLIKFTIFISF